MMSDTPFPQQARFVPQASVAPALQALQGLSVFAGLPTQLLDTLASSATLLHYAKDAVIAHSQDNIACFRFLVSGSARVQLETQGKRKKVVEIVGEGYNFDECVPAQTARPLVCVVAQSAVTVLSIPLPVVVAQMQVHPALALQLMGSLSRRVSQLVVELHSHIFDNAMQRFVRYLLRLVAPPSAPALSGPVRVTLPAGKAVVASRLSLSPEYFSRMLHQLETEKLIEVDHRTIAIPDFARLVATYLPELA